MDHAFESTNKLQKLNTDENRRFREQPHTALIAYLDPFLKRIIINYLVQTRDYFDFFLKSEE